MSVGVGRERQFEVYVAGARGTYPSVPVSFERLQRAARGRMSAEGYAYVAGGAGREETIRANRAAFERWRIVPRMLRDVSSRDTRSEVLGTPLPSPFVLCPIGVLEVAHREADVAVGRAAAAEGIPLVFSNQASRPMEEVARAMALGALAHSRAQLAVAVTGIAGPGGGTPAKPVGTVWLALARLGGPVQAERLQLQGERTSIREQTVEHALQRLIALATGAR